MAWLIGAAVLTMFGVVLSALRWKTVLDALGLRRRLRRLLPLYFAGQFVSNVLPTTIGGDVLRVSRLSKENGDTPDTFASVVLERLTGWLVLPLITFVGLDHQPRPARPGRGVHHRAWPSPSGTLIALAGVLVLADHPTPRRALRATARAGAASSAPSTSGSTACATSPRPPPERARASVSLYQLVLCLAALIAAHALGIGDVGLTPLLAFFPAVLIAQVLPIGISGLGVREGAFVLFLTPLGVPAEQAIALGLLLYLLNLVVSLAGAPAFAIGNRAATPPATAEPSPPLAERRCGGDADRKADRGPAWSDPSPRGYPRTRSAASPAGPLPPPGVAPHDPRDDRQPGRPPGPR